MEWFELCEKVLHQPVKIIRSLRKEGQHYPYYCNFTESNALIKQMLESGKPCMVCRFGTSELGTVAAYLHSRENFFRKIYHVFNNDSINWNTSVKVGMCRDSGFFPAEDAYLDRFAELMLNDIPQADILGAWQRHELGLSHYLRNVKAVPLQSLEPYLHADPWSGALAGKKVLVVHPFVASIRQQYPKRKLLFKDPRVLPDFELKTILAVQSAAGNRVDFPDWFAALDHMKKQISDTDFDIAIIGAGAYGFPLAAHVKRMGKQAIHLAGVTQILFGIRGNRWENIAPYNEMFNEAWVRPLPEETPRLASQMEAGNAPYW